MKLHLFTANYPYGFGESYLNNELPYLNDEFDEPIIYPLLKKGEPQSAFDQGNTVSYNENREQEIQLNFSDKLFVLRLFFIELFHMNKKLFFLKNARKFLALLKQGMKLSKWVETQNINPSDAYYSYWMNEWALALCILKKRKKINKFVFRVNGYDIWNERHENNYLPFRYIIYSQTSRVIALSKSSEAYLKGLNIFSEKITHCYFGTKDMGLIDPRDDDEYVIFSCSSAIPLKRLDKIAEVVSRLPFKVKWHHHGDGPTFNDLSNFMSKAPKNITFGFSKKVENYFEVLQMQKNMAPDLVINLSSTEGLPVTLIEAISFGIPILANNVGSCSEVATNETGVLVDVDESVYNIVETIIELKNRNESGRVNESVRSFWEENFASEKIYPIFALDLKKIFE